MSEKRKITIYKNNRCIEFINNGIAFSQFGIANEILDLINDIQLENEKLHKELDYADNYNIYLIAKLDKIKEAFKDYGNKEDISDITMYYISGESLIHILELLEEIK